MLPTAQKFLKPFTTQKTMSSFDFLGSEQTIFSNPDALDPDFIPKLLPHRENEQQFVATAIKPLFHGRTGISLIVSGPSGIGKTVSVKRVVMDLEEHEEADDIVKLNINCWKANTTYKVLSEIATQLGLRFIQNLKTNELINKVIGRLEQYDGVVIVLDEIDKADDTDFLYHILENIKKRTIILLTNEPNINAQLDYRIISRLTPETLEFKEYTASETFDILKERLKYAFYQDTWDTVAFEELARVASGYKDIRVGITLLKITGELAEQDSSKKVTLKHVREATKRISTLKPAAANKTFKDEEKIVLEICEKNSGKTTGELYKSYTSVGGKKSEKTFKRTLDALKKKGVIKLKPTGEGFQGRSSIIEYLGPEKKLTDF
jgi:archaeal cell division control protein 6